MMNTSYFTNSTAIPTNTTSIDSLDESIQQTISNLLTPEEKAIKIPTGATSPMSTSTNLDKKIKQKIQEDEVEEDEDIVEDEEVKKETEAEKDEKKEINEKRNPVIRMFGHDIDRDSLIVHSAIIAIWIFIWYGTGLKKAIGKDVIFSVVFVLFIIYNIASIATAGTSSGGVVYELNILLTVEQMVSILFGTVVLFSLFHKNIPVNENCKAIIHRICISNVIILTISSLWVSVWTSGRAFRSIRKFKQGIYNIALALFISVGIIFIKGNCNIEQK